jgi:hypothetical protein
MKVEKNGRNRYTVTDNFGVSSVVKSSRHPVSHRPTFTCPFGHIKPEKCDMIKDVIKFVAAERKAKREKKAALNFLDISKMTATDLIADKVAQTNSTSASEPTVKSILDGVVAFLNKGNDDSKMLWNVLTALRGPDNGDEKLKENTTMRLRHAIGLQQTRLGAMTDDGIPVGLDKIYKPTDVHNPQYRAMDFLMANFDNRLANVKPLWHFSDHYVSALAALLELDYLKQEKTE